MHLLHCWNQIFNIISSYYLNPIYQTCILEKNIYHLIINLVHEIWNTLEAQKYVKEANTKT